MKTPEQKHEREMAIRRYLAEARWSTDGAGRWKDPELKLDWVGLMEAFAIQASRDTMDLAR